MSRAPSRLRSSARFPKNRRQLNGAPMPSDPSSLLFRHPSRRLPRAELREFLEALVRRVALGRGFTCLLTDDHEMRRLNREFRGKNYATDVLSFPGEIAEIAISVDRAAAQAAEQGHSLADEVRILMLHGALHLTGMD